MVAHTLAVHSGVYPYAFDQCDVRFKTMGDVRRHQRSKHTEQRTKICSECQKRLSNSCTLQQHMLTRQESSAVRMRCLWVRVCEQSWHFASQARYACAINCESPPRLQCMRVRINKRNDSQSSYEPSARHKTMFLLR